MKYLKPTTNPLFQALIVSVLCLMAAIFAGSRAFSIGLLVSIWFLLSLKYSDQKKLVFLIGLFLLSVFLIIAYNLKNDSSLGRILIYKISFNILKDHYITGIGYGKFKMLYMHYQAQYFASAHYTTKELLLADNIIYAYNDYFQLIIELGIIGITLLISYIYFIIITFKKIYREGSSRNLLFLFSLMIYISVTVAAIFNFEYSRPVVQALFMLSISVVTWFVYLQQYKKVIIFYFAGCFALMVTFISFSYNEILHYKAYQEFTEAKELSSAGFKTEALNKCSEIYPQLKNDYQYLLYYGPALLRGDDPEKALSVLITADKLVSCNSLYTDIGECYYLTRNFKKAEISYILAINMVPNRFESRYKLYNFYKNTRQNQKALQVGQAILKLPVKINSPYAAFIRNNVSRDLKTLQ